VSGCCACIPNAFVKERNAATSRFRCGGCRQTALQFHACDRAWQSVGRQSASDCPVPPAVKYALDAYAQEFRSGRNCGPTTLAARATSRQPSPETLLACRYVGREAADLDEARPKGERSLAGCSGRFPQLARACGMRVPMAPHALGPEVSGAIGAPDHAALRRLPVSGARLRRSRNGFRRRLSVSCVGL